MTSARTCGGPAPRPGSAGVPVLFFFFWRERARDIVAQESRTLPADISDSNIGTGPWMTGRRKSDHRTRRKKKTFTDHPAPSTNNATTHPAPIAGTKTKNSPKLARARKEKSWNGRDETAWPPTITLPLIPPFFLSWADRGRLRSSLACNTLVPSLFLLICLAFFPSLSPGALGLGPPSLPCELLFSLYIGWNGFSLWIDEIGLANETGLKSKSVCFVSL